MDGVAYRTRARCRQEPAHPVSNTDSLNVEQRARGRRRLRKAALSNSHEVYKSSALPSDSEQDGSVSSTGVKFQEDDAKKRGTGFRARRHIVVSSPSTCTTSDDSDVVIVGEFQSDERDVVINEPKSKRHCPSAIPHQNPSIEAAEHDLGDDEELRIVGMVGQVVTRDLPHPRPDCAEHRFIRSVSASESNSRHCGQCYCFVCDVKVSECKFWATGHRERDHANASSHHPAWIALRKAARAGDKAQLQREFGVDGPLRMPAGLTGADGMTSLNRHQPRQSLQQQQQQREMDEIFRLFSNTSPSRFRQQQHRELLLRRESQQERRRRRRTRQDMLWWDTTGELADPDLGEVDILLAAMMRLRGETVDNDNQVMESRQGSDGDCAAQQGQQPLQSILPQPPPSPPPQLPRSPQLPLPQRSVQSRASESLPQIAGAAGAPVESGAATLNDLMRPGPPPQHQPSTAPPPPPCAERQTYNQVPFALTGGGNTLYSYQYEPPYALNHAPQQQQPPPLLGFQPSNPVLHSHGANLLQQQYTKLQQQQLYALQQRQQQHLFVPLQQPLQHIFIPLQQQQPAQQQQQVLGQQEQSAQQQQQQPAQQQPEQPALQQQERQHLFGPLQRQQQQQPAQLQQQHLHQYQQYQAVLLQRLQYLPWMAPGPQVGFERGSLENHIATMPQYDQEQQGQQPPTQPPPAVAFPQSTPVSDVAWAYSEAQGPLRMFPLPK